VPPANADPLTVLSSLLLLGLHRIGGSTDVPLRRACRKKETARFPPVSQSRLEPQPPPPAFDKALRMNVYLLTRWKKFPNRLAAAPRLPRSGDREVGGRRAREEIGGAFTVAVADFLAVFA
jgi:hypothetical protein